MDFLEQVKSSVDIVKVIQEYGVRLKKMGATGRYSGLCPFHEEKTPSFSVTATHQFYRCFGCDAKGDVITFVRERERVTFFEALKILAERNGIPIPKRADYNDPESKLRGALFDMHQIAADLYRKNLIAPQGAEVRDYLAKRGVTAGQAEEFGLGFSLDSWDQLTRRLQEDRYSPELLEKSGLVQKRQEGSGFYDRFRARLMFPIHNESGKAIGFGGRAVKPGDEPKYLNSPETDIYKKSLVLYNLHRAKDAIRKQEHVVLVEGYMDVIGVYSAGVHEVVASCGTALTNTQVRAVKRYSDKIVVNFDPDNAGAKAAERSIQMLLEENMRVRVMELEGGLDPDEFVKQNGADLYRERLKQAAGYFHWLADRARRRFDMNSSEGRIAGLQFLLPAIQRVTDKLERATIAEELASYLGVERGLVLEHFRRSASGGGATPQRVRIPVAPGPEKLLLNALLVSSEARAEVLPRVLELQVFERLAIKSILEALAGLCSGGQTFQFAELEGRLNDRDRDLLAGVIFADEMSEEDSGLDRAALDQARACLRAIEAQDRELQRSSLRERIKAAERKGDFAGAMKMMEELAAFEVKRKR